MNDKSLFAHSIKVIFLLLGIYLIIVNIVSLVVYTRHYATLNTALDYTTFSGWHDYQPLKFHSFSWFFERLESFPGFNQLSETIDQFKVILASGVQNAGTWGTLLYICNMIGLPFKVLWAIIVDIINTLIWFFSFLNTI